MLSQAVDPGAIAKTVGYGLGFKDFSEGASMLPQRITIFSVIELAKQAGFTDWNVRHTMSSVSEVLEKFGNCPAYYLMRILKPVNGGGVGSIPIDIYPILETTGVQAAGTLTIIGTATSTATHKVVFNGRSLIDSQTASYVVELGDTPDEIRTKMRAAIDALIVSSVLTADNVSAGVIDLTSKWQTVIANEIDISINVGTDDAGIVYTLPTMASGAGLMDISTALTNIGEIWTTGIINTLDASLWDIFENFNGVPSELGGTGRWNALVSKPLIACTGTVESVKATLLATTAARKTDLTNCLAPAPNSKGFTFEAAANMMSAFLFMMHLKPHSTAAELYYYDMPFPVNGDIGDFANYGNRNELVKGGVSTVTFDGSAGYRIEDFITFRRLDVQAEDKKDWRYCRDIVGIDFNVIFNYKNVENTYLLAKTTVPDSQTISSDISVDVIKPKDWKAILFEFFDDLARIALIADSDFSKSSLQVEIDGSNPKRFNTLFYYKRTSTVRISSTTAYAGFYFG